MRPTVKILGMVLALFGIRNPSENMSYLFGMPFSQSCLNLLGVYWSLTFPLRSYWNNDFKVRYYQLQRLKDDRFVISWIILSPMVCNRSSSRTTVRLFESSLRLAEAHAKLMFRNRVLIQVPFFHSGLRVLNLSPVRMQSLRSLAWNYHHSMADVCDHSLY